MAVMTLQDMSWLLLVALFLASLLIVLAWLVQYSRAILYSQSRKTSSEKTTRSLPENLSHQSQAGGIWGTLLRLRFNRDGSGGDTEAGVKGLLSSLFSFRSFRENWIRAWVRALNEQAFRDGSSIQITFEDSLQLLSSASISHVSCTDQSANSMVLQCSCEVDIVTFPVTVTQQSPAAVSIDTYQVTAAPVQVQQVTEGSDDQVDMNMIAELVEDTLFSTQPTMIINLKSCMSSIGGSGERLILGVSPPSQGIPMLRLVVRQLRAAVVRGGSLAGWAELCCALDLTPPILERRTRFLPLSSGSGMEFEWSEDITLDLGHDTKELKIRLVERNSKGERFLPGHASLLLDVPRKSPVGRHVLSVSPGHGLPSTGNVTFELLFLEPGDPCGSQGGTALRSLITPTKKVEMDRTIMPDGTIVTTVTTIQSRPKLDRKLESPSCSPSKVEVTEKKPTLLADSNHDRISPIPSSDTHLSNGLDPVAETAIRQLTESASKVAKKTPTKRSTLIISGVSKVPIAEDDAALSIGYAAAMDAALQGEQSSGALNHYTASFPGALQHDPDETTPSDISERPSVDDVESETGSTGALETRSLKDHKVGFLRSGTKLLFRRRHGQKDPSLSQSHEDVSNLGNGSAMRKKSGSFSRRLIKRFSFRSKSKGKVSANGGTGMAEN
ncbi:phospholipid transfer protein C2CD2L isoform X4 [Megalops cyprinoides]|uniref:phospholipid transfer protein C2CD2L isoform X4 n=1 Tax=Megalops cyprinoides TaxID=118141 RepID=UPI001864C832|nr:phospholipid transfer protein C2CD2L isoform X4 [Megalops cyprinoides]